MDEWPLWVNLLLLSCILTDNQFFRKPTKSMHSGYLKTFFSCIFYMLFPQPGISFPQLLHKMKNSIHPLRPNSNFISRDIFWPSSWPWKKITCSTLRAPIHSGHTMRPPYPSSLLFSLWNLCIHFFQLITRYKFTFLFQNSWGELYVLESSEPCIIYTPRGGWGSILWPDIVMQQNVWIITLSGMTNDHIKTSS